MTTLVRKFATSMLSIMLLLGCLLCGLALFGVARAAPPAVSSIWRRSGPDPHVVVPGGCVRQAPANTARALAMAGEDGLDAVELAVRRTKDGKHIVFDADRLDDRTSGDGLVKDHTLAEIQALDAGSWFAKRFAGAKILTLAETLAATKDGPALLLDCRDVDPAALAQVVVAAGAVARTAVRGPEAVVQKVREEAGGKIVALVEPPADLAVVDWASTAKPELVLLMAANVTADTCTALHAAGAAVLADATGDADTPDGWDALAAAGVDLVRTDFPEECLVRAIARRVPQRPVLYAAHRGASRYAPENTLASLSKAVRLAADFVEIDVHTTSDSAFFLLHDGTLDRTTNGQGRVRSATRDTLRTLDAGSWFGKPYAGAQVPELDGYLAQFPPQMGLYFDAKDIAPDALAAAVEKNGLVERTIVYQGPVYLEKLKQINPKIRLLAPVAAASHVDTLAKRLAPYAVDTPWKLLSREYIEHCHALGIKVFSDAKGNTTEDEYVQAIQWGIDLIQTDYPLRLWRAIDRANDQKQ